MLRIFRIAAVYLAAFLLLTAAACGGGGDGSGDSDEPRSGAATNAPPDGDAGDAAVLGAVETLGRSAQDFRDEVESLRGEMGMEISMGGAAFGLDGDFEFAAPDQMHMTMQFTGGEDAGFDLAEFGSFEFLLAGDKLYMYMPLLGGWTVATLDELGVDAQQYRDMMNNHSPFDYGNLVESFGDGATVEDMGADEIDGDTYRHYRIQSDLASLADALTGAFSEELAGDGILPLGTDGAIVADVWLDSETLLPHRVTAEGSFAGGDSGLDEMVFSFTLVVAEYNGDVRMPEPPTDARPFSELGAELPTEG